MKEFVYLIMVLLLVGIVSAHTGHDEHSFIEQAEAIINANVSCSSLGDEQFEILGDYYMEQIHPGEEHEAMDAMMGGEGSESLRLMHINMGRSIYCGETNEGYGVMGGMMNDYSGGNMMGYSYSPSYRNSPGSFWLWALYALGLGVLFGIGFWGTKALFHNKRKHK